MAKKQSGYKAKKSFARKPKKGLKGNKRLWNFTFTAFMIQKQNASIAD